MRGASRAQKVREARVKPPDEKVHAFAASWVCKPRTSRLTNRAPDPPQFRGLVSVPAGLILPRRRNEAVSRAKSEEP